MAQIGAIGAIEYLHRAPERKRALIEHSHLLRFGQNVSHFGFDAHAAEHQHQCHGYSESCFHHYVGFKVNYAPTQRIAVHHYKIKQKLWDLQYKN